MKYILVCTKTGILEECDAENPEEAKKNLEDAFRRSFQRDASSCSDGGEHFIVTREVCVWLKA
mgnify:CR=1 FL=1